MARLMLRAARQAKAATNAAAGWATVGMLHTLRLLPRKRMANAAGRLLRKVGPLLKEHRIGRENLRAAFPEKSPQEIEQILAGVWDNLGRLSAEFAHLDRLHILDPDRPGPDDIVYEPETLERFLRLRDDGKPALMFAAHLANWELPAYVAASYGLKLNVLYRRPNIGGAGDAIEKIRSGSMGTLVRTERTAPVTLVRALEDGDHVAMLVDQYNWQGVDVTFFGRPTKANATLARLARHVECPIHGARIVRLPDGHRFRVDVTEEIKPVRDAEGKIDVQGTMQVVTNVIEGWIRQHPEQWLWLHRRWR